VEAGPFHPLTSPSLVVHYSDVTTKHKEQTMIPVYRLSAGEGCYEGEMVLIAAWNPKQARNIAKRGGYAHDTCNKLAKVYAKHTGVITSVDWCL
jgi:hypothetical protein